MLVVFQFTSSIYFAESCVSLFACVRSFVYVVIACMCAMLKVKDHFFGLNSLLTWMIGCMHCWMLGN